MQIHILVLVGMGSHLHLKGNYLCRDGRVVHMLLLPKSKDDHFQAQQLCALFLKQSVSLALILKQILILVLVDMDIHLHPLALIECQGDRVDHSHLLPRNIAFHQNQGQLYEHLLKKFVQSSLQKVTLQSLELADKDNLRYLWVDLSLKIVQVALKHLLPKNKLFL